MASIPTVGGWVCQGPLPQHFPPGNVPRGQAGGRERWADGPGLLPRTGPRAGGRDPRSLSLSADRSILRGHRLAGARPTNWAICDRKNQEGKYLSTEHLVAWTSGSEGLGCRQGSPLAESGWGLPRPISPVPPLFPASQQRLRHWVPKTNLRTLEMGKLRPRVVPGPKSQRDMTLF